MEVVALRWTSSYEIFLSIYMSKSKPTPVQIHRFNIVGFTQYIPKVWWLSYTARSSCNCWLPRVVGCHHLAPVLWSERWNTHFATEFFIDHSVNTETWSIVYIQAFRQWELSNFQSVLLLIQLSYSHINSPGLLGFWMPPSITDWPPLLTHSKLLVPQSFAPLSPSCLFLIPVDTSGSSPPLSAPWTPVRGICRAGKWQPSCFVTASGATAAGGSQKKQFTMSQI